MVRVNVSLEDELVRDLRRMVPRRRRGRFVSEAVREKLALVAQAAAVAKSAGAWRAPRDVEPAEKLEKMRNGWGPNGVPARKGRK